MAADLVRRNLWQMALALILMFDFYLRPGELYDIRVGHLSPPVAAGGLATRHWALTVRPYEGGRPAKTGAFDDTVVLDHPSRLFLGTILEGLTSGRGREQLLLPAASPRDFPREFQKSAKHLGLNLVPYQARHGGASEDKAAGIRSLMEIKKRGRWQAEASVRRYEKHGKLAARLGRLSPALRAHLQLCAAQIEGILMLTIRPPVFTA